MLTVSNLIICMLDELLTISLLKIGFEIEFSSSNFALVTQNLRILRIISLFIMTIFLLLVLYYYLYERIHFTNVFCAVNLISLNLFCCTGVGATTQTRHLGYKLRINMCITRFVYI